MFRLFPSMTYRLVTEHSTDSLAALLRASTTDRPRGGPAHTFRGAVGEKDFEINGIHAYRSSFLPRVKGRILPRPEGAEIIMEMRPHRVVTAFFSIWYLFLFLSALVIFLAALRESPLRFFLLGIPCTLGALTTILSTQVFKSDCRWTMEAIAENVATVGGEGSPNGSH